MSKNLILVTGATGKQGGAVARELLAHGWPVRAMTRNPESEAARALGKAGAQIVMGDLNDAASLERALAGVWGVYGVQNTWEAGVEREEEQGKRLAELAKKAGVQHFVYSSVGSAHGRTGIPHFDNKWRVEETVRALNFPSHVVLRPVFFMENFLTPNFLPALHQGQLIQAIKHTTELQMISVRDIGKYGLWAFENATQLNGRAIDIAGDSLTFPQTAEVLSQALGHEVKFVPGDIEQVRSFSEDWALMLEWFDAVGYEADIPKHSQESGIHPTTFAEWAKTAEWSAPKLVS
jgi:uncharacterized protein YbjT (DUF2867 family)